MYGFDSVCGLFFWVRSSLVSLQSVYLFAFSVAKTNLVCFQFVRVCCCLWSAFLFVFIVAVDY